MYEFLRQRRNGVLVLIAAGLLMVGWLRSLIVSDQVFIEGHFGGRDQTLYFYRSSNNAIRLICRYESVGRKAQEQELAVIPYSVIVVPLTLLSVYLILWKPRPKQGSGPPQS